MNKKNLSERDVCSTIFAPVSKPDDGDLTSKLQNKTSHLLGRVSSCRKDMPARNTLIFNLRFINDASGVTT
jgi:hypothetical protein